MQALRARPRAFFRRSATPTTKYLVGNLPQKGGESHHEDRRNPSLRRPVPQQRDGRSPGHRSDPPHRPHQGLIVFSPVKNWGSRSGGHRPLDPSGRWASGGKTSRLIAIYISRLLSSLVICPRNSYLWPRSPHRPGSARPSRPAARCGPSTGPGQVAAWSVPHGFRPTRLNGPGAAFSPPDGPSPCRSRKSPACGLCAPPAPVIRPDLGTPPLSESRCFGPSRTTSGSPCR